ncbi:MAG: GNAT family N-acetyltransferase [Promethearchaeota archaeon]
MIQFRPATLDDSEFLYNLKKRTLKEYITQIWGWDEKDQHNYHKENFNPEKFSIIQLNGEDIGCMSIEEHPNKIRLNMIEISPEYQNKGIGSKLIRDLIEKGSQEKKTIELQVFKVNNEAFRLYTTLGFKLIDETETHYKMVFHR